MKDSTYYGDNNKNSEELPTLKIKIESLQSQYEIFGGEIENNRSKYLKFLMNNPTRREDYRKVINLVLEVEHTNRSQEGGGSYNSNKAGGGLGIDKTKDLIAFILCHHYETINPTDPQKAMSGGGLNPFSLMAMNPLSMMGMNPMDKFIPGFNSNYTPYVCTQQDSEEIQYLMSQTPPAPQPADILKKLLPLSYVEKAEQSGQTGTQFIDHASMVLDALSKALSTLDTSEGDFWTRVAKSTGQVAISTGLAVASMGTGGDNIAALPTAVAKGVSMITKLFVKLDKILNKLKNMAPAIQKGLAISKVTLDKTGSAIKSGTELLTEVRTDEGERLEEIRVQMEFFYNLFTVDFRAGPGGVRCWVEEIFGVFLNSAVDPMEIDEYERMGDINMADQLHEKNIGRIKSLMCLVNDIFMTINKTLLSFIGSALDTAIPDSLGLIGILFEPIFSGLSTQMYTSMRDEAEKRWNGIFEIIERRDPTMAHLLYNGFNDPQQMVLVGDYLFDKANNYSFGLTDKILKRIPEEALNKMDNMQEMVGHVINKGVTYMFVFINMFAILAEINSGKSKFSPYPIGDILNEQCPKYLEAVTELAKKGKDIASQVKSVNDVKRVGKEYGKNRVTKTRDYGRQEYQKISTDADKYIETLPEVTMAERDVGQQRLDEKYRNPNEMFETRKRERIEDIPSGKRIKIHQPLVFEERVKEVFDQILERSERIKNAITHTKKNFNLTTKDMENLIRGRIYKAAKASQIENPYNTVYPDPMTEAMAREFSNYYDELDQQRLGLGPKPTDMR